MAERERDNKGKFVKSDAAANSSKTAGKSKGKVIGIPFKPGVSGNPNGRPKKPETLLKQGEKSIEALIQMANNEETPVKVRADIHRWLAEMSYGKAQQSVDMDADVKSSSEIKVEFEGVLNEWSK